MSRLPTPGGDTGNWGTILNDYLSQSHAADGSLKPGVVASGQVQDGAITIGKLGNSSVGSAQIQDSSVTSAKLGGDAVGTAHMQDASVTLSKLAPGIGGRDSLRKLLIYYANLGTPTAANASDVLLLESWVYNSDAYTSPYYATFSDIKTRADTARAYRQSLGIRLFAVNILGYTGRTDTDIDPYRGVGEALSRIWRLDGYGIAASNYSATGADVALVSPRASLLLPSPARPSAVYNLNNPWAQIEASDLGIIVHYETGQHTWTQL